MKLGKKIIYTCSMLSLLLGFNACESFLEEENPSEITAESYITEDTADELVVGMYSSLRDVYKQYATAFYGTDIFTTQNAYYSNNSLNEYYNMTSSVDGVEGVWDSNYEVISNANSVIHQYENVISWSESNATAKAYGIAQAKGLRALAYYNLVQQFGGVVLLLDDVNEISFSYTRSSEEEVFNQIIADLEDAIPDLESYPEFGRFSKRAAEHLLADVYVTRGYKSFGGSDDFTTAAQYAELAIDSYDILSQTYAEVFDYDNQENDEILFSIQYGDGGEADDRDNDKQGILMNQVFNYLGIERTTSPYGEVVFAAMPTDFFFGLFDDNDTRDEVTVFRALLATETTSYTSDYGTDEINIGDTIIYYPKNTLTTADLKDKLNRYFVYQPGQYAYGALFNVNGKLGPCDIVDGKLVKSGDKELTGELVNASTIRRPKPTKVFFKVALNTGVESVVRDDETGNYLVRLLNKTPEVLMKVGISYTSVENAAVNMQTELAHWNFDQVVNESKEEWNGLLSRIEIEGGSDTAQRRFYTDLWHALQGRRTISDANGAYPDNTGDTFRVGQLPLDEAGKPLFNHYNSDAFWGAQWTINTLWGLVYPEIMNEFVQSLMQYYKDGGLVPRGPSGGNYTYVMTGASSTPFIVSAIQKGIVKGNLEAVYQALKITHSVGGIMEKAGYEHKTSIGGGFKYYHERGYVPYPLPEGDFGFHQDGASLTMEYAYQDWTLAQLAKKLGHKEDYRYFLKRSGYYKNTFDKEAGWMRPREVNGKWHGALDPYKYETGFNESNGAQSTWFVPHDIDGLAELMGGKEKAVEKLNTQFEAAEKLGFTSGGSHDRELHPEYRCIPINYGNQPSMQTAQVFNQLNRPDLSQYWTRKVVNKVFSGLSPATGFNGDEDQGLMGSLSVLLKLGLFQMNGGTEENPQYQIGSPIFNKVTIHLNPDFYPGETFVIKANNNSDDNFYVKSIKLNNQLLSSPGIQHDAIVKGGTLVLELTDTLNK